MDGTAAAPAGLDPDYRLADNLTRTHGRIFLTGTQPLVRMMITQRRLDRQRGLNTAGFATGYRGSPLAGVDLAMWRAADALQAHQISFLPAINEDLGATMMMGTQQAGLHPERTVDGVFGLWYGKGPGVDRAGDALHHGHAAGASRHGGVLLVVGDDHTAVSSSIPHASEPSLAGWRIPIVHPASVDEYESFGLYGWALSRYSGAWVALKVASETVESGRACEVAPPVCHDMPEDPALPRAALEYSAREFLTPAIEARMDARLRAVAAFARRHGIDRLVSAAPAARAGIIAVGKAYLDTVQALAQLGIRADAPDCPLRIYKPGLVWPLEPGRLADFVQGLAHVLVIEEKGAFVETQVKDMLYNLPARPVVEGKHDASGAALIPAAGQLRPSLLAEPLAGWLSRAAGLAVDARGIAQRPEPLSNDADGMRRSPYFCSGCPHSSSTRVPEGSKALSGVGCHYMAAWMDRDTGGLTQMGGEGADWIGLARYTRQPHVFQNMGEGTYYHSGHLAIRQAVAAGVDMTYKILFNDAVAMTGGQPVDGPISVPQIARQMLAEGVRRVVITSDDAGKYRGVAIAPGVEVHDRRELDRIQRELRDTPGVTVLIHDQACAAEKRRRRKKNTYPDPPRRLVINTQVCEGCGDCGVQSNCLSLVPVETPDGRKRAIDQSSCNKDYSCVEGFCPSFVSVLGGSPRKHSGGPGLDARQWTDRATGLPQPAPAAGRPHNLLLVGMGGTGVVTLGAVVAMAAHLEGRAASLLDMTGMAQKGGSVISHVRIGAFGHAPPAPVRIDWQQADAVIVCDPVAGIGADALGTIRPGHTQVLVNSHVAPLSEFTRNPDAAFRPEALMDKLRHAAGGSLLALDAHQAALALFGDGILANMFLLGLAWQRGAVPVSLAALERAVHLNGVAVADNLAAFACGRVAGHDPQALQALMRPSAQVIRMVRRPGLQAIVERGVAVLTAYQDAGYARRYADFVAEVAERERQATGDADSPRLAREVATQLPRLMAYKDEYEVARLYTDGSFARQLSEQFEGRYTLRLHMAPPVLARKDPRTGAPRKMAFGPGMLRVLRLLARGRRLRGSWLDPFGYTRERRMERALVQEYRQAIGAMLAQLHAGNRDHAVRIAGLAAQVRGFGHVKARAAAAYRALLAQELAAFCAPAPGPTTAAARKHA